MSEYLGRFIALILAVLLLEIGLSESTPDGPVEVVPASAILAKIQNGGPVEYDNVIIEGDLDLGKLDLRTRHVNRTSYEIEFLGLSETSKVVGSSIKITEFDI